MKELNQTEEDPIPLHHFLTGQFLPVSNRPPHRTEHVLWRLSQGQVDGMHPKVVAVMIGTNNLGNNTDEQIVEGVQAVVAEYQKRCPDAVILLQGIFPRGAEPTDPARAHIKAINEKISKLGDGKKVIYVDLADKFLSPDGNLSKEVMPDSLHPSAKGYVIWADAIAPILNRLLKNPRGARC